VSVSATQSVIDRYFKAMGAEEDFSRFYDDEVTWLMVDSGQEVQGPGPSVTTFLSYTTGC
jgi:hypothetical protein